MAQGRRWRRSARAQGVLPLQRVTHVSHTFSCWYCNFKITAFNDVIYNFGRRHARFLLVWFAIGVGFSIMALVGTTLILLWELVSAGYPFSANAGVVNLSVNWLLGISQFSGLSISLVDVVVMIQSTLAAVTVHEFGHTLAAASQGIQVEYVAMFVAIIFPGAFVAFNYDLLQSSSLLTSLRIYCAGIWHNVVFCAVCGIALFLLPYFLYPLYIHGQSPMVLHVAPTSPLSSYLSQGDVIVSLDGTHIHHPQEWIDKLVRMDTKMINESYYDETSRSNQAFTDRKGYCVPISWVEDAKRFWKLHDDFSCPDELATFVSLSCSTSSLSGEEKNATRSNKKTEDKFCLVAKDVVKLKKCGDGWEIPGIDRSCPCPEGESCMAPSQVPGMTWVEISFSRPDSSECFKNERNQSSLDLKSTKFDTAECGGAFVFIGDAVSLVSSVMLSAYHPRWASGGFGLYLPTFFEKVISYSFRSSASLALFNSLPAFFLDGESILETCLQYIGLLGPRNCQRVLRVLLGGGTLLSFSAIVRILFAIFGKSA